MDQTGESKYLFIFTWDVIMHEIMHSWPQPERADKRFLDTTTDNTMSRGIILYRSRYGSSRKYAEWIADETGYTCMEERSSGKDMIGEYDTVILVGPVYASGITIMPFLKRHLGELKGKRTAVFCVGATPMDETGFRQFYSQNFPKELHGTPCFYGRGAWNKKAMNLTDRLMCMILRKSLKRQSPSEYEPWQEALAEASGKVCDWTDRKYLQPLLDWDRKGRDL